MRYYSILILFLCKSLYPILAQDYRSEILKSTSYYQIENNKLIETDSVIMQINTRQGDLDAEIYIGYSKGSKIDIQYAQIEDISGNVIRKLSKKDISDQSYISDGTFYQDDFMKSFSLKHNIYPYRISYSFKRTLSKYVTVTSVDHSLVNKQIHDGKIIVEAPIEQKILYKQKNIDLPRIDTINGKIYFKWEYQYKLEKNQKYVNVNNSPAPQLTVLSKDFNYGKSGSFESWVSLGNWITDLNKGRGKLTVEEELNIKNLIRDIADDKEKVRILYHYLQDNTRYINVNINIGGLQAYPAEYVCQNKFGDCKALCNYMQALLQYAGIKSYYTLINSGNKILDIDKGFPMQTFDHVILTVPIDSDTLFLECTSKDIPCGYMGVFTQGREALIVEQDASRFISIPSLKSKDVLCSRKFNIDVMSGNTTNVNLSTVQRGEKYDLSNYLINNLNKNTIQEYVQNNVFSGTFDLIDYQFVVNDRDSAWHIIKANCVMHDMYKIYGKNIVFKPIPFDIPRFEDPNKRTLDLQIDYPIFYKDTIIYNIAPNLSIKKLPDNLFLEYSDGGDYYKFSSEQIDNKIYIYKEVYISPKRLLVSQYKDFYQFMQVVTVSNNNKFYIELQ